MFLPKFKKFIKLMKDEFFNNTPAKKNHFSWAVDETKYLNLEKVKKLRGTCQKVKAVALKNNGAKQDGKNNRGNKVSKIIAVRNWFMVELGLFTGLRVEEMANLKASDLHLQEEQSSLTVRKGKGNKSRTVYFSETFKKECLFYLQWKEGNILKGGCIDARGDGCREKDNDYLFTNRKGRQLTKRALQKAFKRCLTIAKLESRYSIHCLRHTYGSFLYKSSNHNLRLVQEQLGHSSIRTTQVYASLLDEEVKEAVKRLYQ